MVMFNSYVNVYQRVYQENGYILSGWWYTYYTYPSEKYESQLGSLFPIYGKKKNVPNHQPGIYYVVNENGIYCILIYQQNEWE